MSETKEPKTVRKDVAIALGIICMILAVSLVGVIADYALIISVRDSTIASLNSQVSQLQNQLNNLTQVLTARGVTDGFMLTMTLEKTQYSLGEPINVTLALTNISNQTVSFWLDYSFSYFQFFVYNSTMNRIYSSLWGILLPLAVSYTLDAGQSMSDSYSWNQTWNESIFSGEGIAVLPGTYYIVGQVGPMQQNNIVFSSTIETTPIQITIV
jgi:hypothetical protein